MKTRQQLRERFAIRGVPHAGAIIFARCDNHLAIGTELTMGDNFIMQEGDRLLCASCYLPKASDAGFAKIALPTRRQKNGVIGTESCKRERTLTIKRFG